MRFENRVVQYPNRYKLVKADGTEETVRLIRDEGNVTKAGTQMNAEFFRGMMSFVGEIKEFCYTGISAAASEKFDSAEKMNAFFGGVWEPFAGGRMLLGQGGSYADGAVGGEKTVKLERENLPRFNGDYCSWDVGASDFNGYISIEAVSKWGNNRRGWIVHSENEVIPDIRVIGNDQPHNNMPPYTAVYRWRRIA